MKKSINLKVVGYVPVSTNSRGKTIVLSREIMTKKDSIAFTSNRVVKQSLDIIEHALNLDVLRADFLRALDNIQKGKKMRFMKSLFTASVGYFRAACAKIKLYRYIAQLNYATKTYLNEFLNYSQMFNFSLTNLKLR